jgi:hypothetical protein
MKWSSVAVATGCFFPLVELISLGEELFILMLVVEKRQIVRVFCRVLLNMRCKWKFPTRRNNTQEDA